MSFPRLVIRQDEDTEDALAYAKQKEWFNHAEVVTEDGERFPVHFVTPLRAQQELEGGDMACYAEPGILLVPDLSMEAMERAVEYAWEDGYYKSIKPLAKDDA